MSNDATPVAGTARVCARCGGCFGFGSLSSTCPSCLFSGIGAGPIPLPGTGTTVGPYYLLQELGRGAMGTVHLALHLELDRFIALKSIGHNLAADAEAETRFIQEARAAARLRHAHITAVHEIARYEGKLYYAMEYAEGGDLADTLRRRGGRLPSRKAAILGAKVARALQHAHDEGVVHRDIKPSNILLDGAGEPKVTDFGLALLAANEKAITTMAGTVFGTPAYLAPERITGKVFRQSPGAGDIYALGVVLFQILAGRTPHEGENLPQLLHAIANHKTPRLRAADKKIPAELAEICDACLEKDPAARPRQAAEIADALDAWSGERTETEPAAKPKRSLAGHTIIDLGPFQGRRRRRRLFRAMTVGAGALLAATAVFLALYYFSIHYIIASSNQGTTAIAVLPLEALDADPNTAVLASGLQDEIITTLTRITSLRVISATSPRAGAEKGDHSFGSRLGAQVVLTGKMRIVRDQAWVSVRMVNSANGETRWSHVFLASTANALNLQTDIATDIAVELNSALNPLHILASAGTSSKNSVAQLNYIKARQLRNDASHSVDFLNRAADLLQTALQLDPHFALAAAELSLVHSQMYAWGTDRTPARLRLALETAQAALQLNPQLAEAEIALGDYYYRGSQDFLTARQHFNRALALSPRNDEALQSLAQVERRSGAFITAATHFAEALRLDPINPILAYNTADTYLRLRNYNKAAELLNLSIGLMPEHVALQKLRGDLAVAATGDLAPMREEIRRRDPNLPTHAIYIMDSIEYMVLARELDRAVAFLDASDFDILAAQSIYLTRQGYRALLLDLAGNHVAAKTEAEEAYVSLSRELQSHPDDSRLLLHAGQVQAIMGEVAAGERKIRRTLTPGDPACVDAFDRGFYLRALAITLANAHLPERAQAVLSELLRDYNQSSLNYLKRHPAFANFALPQN